MAVAKTQWEIARKLFSQIAGSSSAQMQMAKFRKGEREREREEIRGKSENSLKGTRLYLPVGQGWRVGEGVLSKTNRVFCKLTEFNLLKNTLSKNSEIVLKQNMQFSQRLEIRNSSKKN